MTTIHEDVDNSSKEEEVAPKEAEEQITQDDQDELLPEEPMMSDHDKMIMELGKKRKHEGVEEVVDSEDSDEADDDNTDDYVDPADELVTLKVNGQEIQRSQAEVDKAGGIAAIQKEISGDMKLKAAAEQRKENEKQQAEAQRVLEENKRLRAENDRLKTNPAPVTPTPAVSDELTAEEKAEAQALTDKMFQGDASELQSVMELMVKAKRQSNAQPQQVQQPVDSAALAEEVEFQIDKRNAVKTFESQTDLSGSKYRRTLVNEFTKDVYQEHKEWTPTQIMNESIKRARAELNLPDPSVPAKKEDKLEDKKNTKKKAADVIPQANRRRDTSKPKVKVMSKRELFEDIASKRSHG